MERLDVHKWADLIETHKPRRAGLPPAGMQMLLDARIDRKKFSSLESWHTGAAPVPPELVENLEAAYGIPVIVTYGATEFGQAAQWTIDMRKTFGRAKRGSSGRAIPGVELQVVDPATGAALPAGETGILEVHVPGRSNPHADYWTRTSDLAHMDVDGFLFIDGRADDVIIRGGFKVPLFELETIIKRHPAVVNCAAIGLPDTRLGQVPGVVIVLRDEFVGKIVEAELVAWIREQAPPYYVPVRLRFADSLPLNPSMKVSRSDLVGMLES